MFTVTCFACGMPSSKEWATRTLTRPFGEGGPLPTPYFPFLLDTHPPPTGAIVMEDGSTYLCAFCYALLESQWNAYEANKAVVTVAGGRGQNQGVGGPVGVAVAASQRKYNFHKFICAVCGVETYRKRVRALPFQVYHVLNGQKTLGFIYF